MSRHIFVSDTHVRPGLPGGSHSFLDFLQGPCRDADVVWLLGDIFDYWTGPNHLKGGDYSQLLDALCQVTESGVQVRFIHGNRDYLVGRRFEKRTGVRVVGSSETVTLGGRHVYLAHGDFIYNRNPKYTAYRHVMNFPLLRHAVTSIPTSLSGVLARRFQKVSRKTTPVVSWSGEDILQEAKPFFKRGVDVVVCGHIHLPQHQVVQLDGVRKEVYILGDWDGGSTHYLEYDGEFRFCPWV